MTWEVKKLGDVCEVIGGGTPSKANNEFYDGDILWATVRDMGGEIITDTEHKITKDAVKNSSTNIIPKGNVIIATRVGLGKICLIKHDTAINQDLRGIVPVNPKRLSVDFLYRWFQSIAHKIVEAGTGATVQGVKLPFVKSLPIPLPPVPEQLRIIAILDEAFENIARAKESAEKNLKNANEIFESYLQSVFENKGEGWKENTLSEIATKIGSGATPRGGNKSYKTEGISLIRSMNVHDRSFKEKNLAFIDEDQANNLSNVTLQEDDVLFNITGASVTRCCVIPAKYLPARVNQHVSIIRPKPEIMVSSFLNLLLTSKYYKDQLLFTGEQGATRQAITKVQLKNFVIHYPPLKEQKSIVAKLDALSAETKKLEAIYNQKLADLEELKKSILAKAFKGELTEVSA